MQQPTRRSKRARVRALFSRIFGNPSNGTGTGFFQNTRNVVMNQPSFYNVQGNHETVTAVMKSLSERIIRGAAYDSADRDSPPRCHPGTRVQLNERINNWFNDMGRQKALLWLKGPAGVGKSAVIQTFAESLAESKCIGATLFFSRPNNRRDPQRVFTTITYQLATRIPAYRDYIAQQIAFDPELLWKGMREQFRIFVVEPFGKRKIAEGEGPWGILLDGLDECEGQDPQCEIVELISQFVLSFPHSPLVWVIASRPEPHIEATFTDEANVAGHWTEYIPIDSPEACQDVERYLGARCRAIRKRFPHVGSEWPSETQILKVSKAASGLFVFAATVIRFIEDGDHADPVSRLNIVIAVIDRSGMAPTGTHPFAFLNALYTEILTSIPPTSWSTTKRILGFVLYARGDALPETSSFRLKSRSLLAASIILGLEQSVIYGSLHKLHSVLAIPAPKNAHKSAVSFFHASFADYLTDATRSKDFFIDLNDCGDDIIRGLGRVFPQKPWDGKSSRSMFQLSGRAKKDFYQDLKHDAEAGVYLAITGDVKTRRGQGPLESAEDRSECLDILSQVNVAELYLNEGRARSFSDWLFKLWECFGDELSSRALVKEAQLRDLKFDHLDYRKNKPICIRHGEADEFPDSAEVLQKFVADLQMFQRKSPTTRVLICGSIPEKSNAFFSYEHYKQEMGAAGLKKLHIGVYYCIPYPD